MRKNNIWNNIFHRKEVKETSERARQYNQLLKSKILMKIEQCEDLDMLLFWHKEAWKQGFQNRNLGPDSCGMFRCKSIPTMTSDQVYLGGIWGLWTFTIPEWNTHRDEKYGCNGFGIDEDTSLYGLIVNQYKRILVSNIKSIIKEAETYVKTARELCYK